MMEAASADKDSHPWREVENAMFAAVTEAVHNKTFELVRLTPDPEGIEKMIAAAVGQHFATAVFFSAGPHTLVGTFPGISSCKTCCSAST